MNRPSVVARALLAAAPLVFLAGCFNLFQPFDNPGGDAQLISSARAAMDRGDFATALADYQKVSDATDADLANSEQAYAILTEYGAGFGAFASAFGSGNVSGNTALGMGLTTIANDIGGNASATARQGIFSAYQLSAKITSTSLAGFVRFVSDIALMSEVLAEQAATPGNLQASDVATTPSACESSGAPSCSGCTARVPSFSSGNTLVTLSTATTTQIAAGASIGLFQGAMDDANTAAGLMGGGSLGGVTGSASQAANAGDAGLAFPSCYLGSLLTLGIGT